MKRQYWRHLWSGDVYAVEVEGGRCVRSCGPLSANEIFTANLPNFHCVESELDSEQFDLLEIPPLDDAERRVNATPELGAHTQTIYDMEHAREGGGEEHWQWIATAPVAQIVAWAESIEEQ